MKYALHNGNKTHAKDVSSGTKGTDLWYTDYEVVACVGKYRQYWKYTGAEPPYREGYENESEWHAAWKEPILDEYCEVICGENREHRADLKTDKYVIEIQKSNLCGFEVLERNRFYKELSKNRLVWIVNIEEHWKKKYLKTTLDKKNNDGRFIVEWKYCRKWIKEIAITNDTFLYLDFNHKSKKLIYLWMNGKGKTNKTMYGKWVDKKGFFKSYLERYLKPEYSISDELLNIFENI
ncbi:MAG: hypothetical protein HRT58_22370 [Crocinitomicaceae bacterium]|nr:hypothetical protein [Flavobacteriales bacterium]NQZ38423.1 hypothetical protein [Crocinitomicaceae bacterium]